MGDNTRRFNDRVADYMKYRPSYPVDIVRKIEDRLGGRHPLTVADVGSGTGLFTKILLERGHKVFAVEPNDQMRMAAEEFLNGTGFTSVGAPAEATSLPDASVDLITVAQAFHWFDREKVKSEFKRILKPSGMVALVWNERRKETGLEKDFETFLQGFPDYTNLSKRADSLNEDLTEFFGQQPAQIKLPNSQTLDWLSFRGRFFSTSYSPVAGTPEGLQAEARLAQIFEKYSLSGFVVLNYETEAHVSAFAKPDAPAATQ